MNSHRGAWMGVLNLKGVTAYADEFASAGDKSVVSGAKAGENVDGESDETYGDKKATSDGGKKAVVSEKAKAIIATVAAVAPTPAATAKASVDEPKKESMYEDEPEEPASDVVEVPDSVKPLPKPDPAPDEKKPFVPPPPPPQDDKKPFNPVSPPDAEYEEDIIEDDTTPKKNIFEEAVAGDDVKAAESDEASYIGSGVYVFAIIAAFAAVGVFLFCSAKKLKVGPASSPFEYIMNGITLIFNPSHKGTKDVSNFQPHHTVGTVEPIAKPGINILAPVKRKTSLGVSPETSIPIESKSVDHNAANDGGWDWEGDDFGEPSVAGQPRKSKDGRVGKDSNDWGDDF
ncbi:hypothetical protein BCR33DRAFT_783532 [Rhizoclosmatium globosum]|uniref:Uncharacterized protein n=1 Tax=Rhizoclosmatium globosum TaxID=329046 RepID=A0A1Y2CHQ7_9FUNG|nr:hypothetical protein BCR33DRAFT_783532 [Rhizoclosmatium globosum]|eukprot:ORY46364.1 hypothetical protein BCR33DRAFT_783532 [Rhizoclosmatium globosum]